MVRAQALRGAMSSSCCMGVKVEKSVASPSFTFLSYSHICEAVLAASFACLSCPRRLRSVGVMATSSCHCVGAELEESVARPSFTSFSQSHLCKAMLAALFGYAEDDSSAALLLVVLFP
jgi:hypothetical protein